MTYVAMLRAVNLKAHNRIAMADLRALCADLGCTDVSTYVQSGNVVFESPDTAGALVGAIERGITSAFGLQVAVLVRSTRELAKVVATNPFVAQGADPAHLHVTFLVEKPEPARVRDLPARALAPEQLAVRGREVYLHLPNGYGRTKLNNAFVEKQLGVTGTTRNWRTVTTLADLA